MAMIDEKTQIPLYHAIGLWVVIVGIGVWAGSTSSNQQALVERQDRFGDAIRSDRQLLLELNERTARVESKQDIMLELMKSRR